MIVDNPSFEYVGANFHLQPAPLGGAMHESINAAGETLESALVDGVNPERPRDIDFAPVDLDRFGGEVGRLGGRFAVNVKESQVGLIGSDGATLISDKGVGFTPTATGVKAAANGLIGPDGATLIGPDGATLIGNGGNTKVTAGRGKVRPGVDARRAERSFVYTLGRYSAQVNDGGDVGVEFVLTKKGRQILRTFGEMNLELKRRNRNPKALPTTFVEAIQPADGRGTGGAWKKLTIK